MIDKETMDAILAEAAGKRGVKQISDKLPAWRNPGPRRKYTRLERKGRKAKRKSAKKARMGKKKKRRSKR